LTKLSTIAFLIPVSTAEREYVCFVFPTMNHIMVDLEVISRHKHLTILCQLAHEVHQQLIRDVAADLCGGVRNRRITTGSYSSSTS